MSAVARLLRLWVRYPAWAWLSVVSVVCCQVEVSVTSWSFVQRVVPTVVRRVWSRDLVNAESPAQWGAVAPKKIHINRFCQLTNSMGRSFPWGAHNCLIFQEILPHFMEFVGSWPWLQELNTYPHWVIWAEKRQTYFCQYILIPSNWPGVSAVFLPGSRELGMRFSSSQSIPKAYYIRRHLISTSICFYFSQLLLLPSSWERFLSTPWDQRPSVWVEGCISGLNICTDIKPSSSSVIAWTLP